MSAYVTGDPSPLREVRGLAVRSGALVSVAVMDLTLAEIGLSNFERELCVESAQRCVEASSRYGLATLPVANLWLAGGAALADDLAAMRAACERALEPDPDDPRIRAEESPYISDPSDRAEVEPLPQGFWRVKLHFGFMERPAVPAALAAIKDPVLKFHEMKTTFFIGRETVLSTRRPDLSPWRGALFAWMTRNTGDVTSYFGLPPGSVVELGARVEV